MTAEAQVFRRTARSDSRSSEGFTIGSDLEEEAGSSLLSSRPGRISIAENLTIYCEDDEDLLQRDPGDSFLFSIQSIW